MQHVVRELATRDNTFFYHINDGYYYHWSYQRNNSIYFKCVLAERQCKGRAVYHRRTGFRHTKRHGHDPDMFYSGEKQMRRTVLRRCANMENKTHRAILEDEADSGRYPDQAADRLTIEKLRTPMRNAQLKNFPPRPRCLLELTATLMQPQCRVLTMTKDGEDNIYCGSVNALDNTHHVVFTSDRMLRHMAASSCIQSDGTFKVVPAGLGLEGRAPQVFCIISSWRHRTIPLVWVIMERHTQAAYEAVLGLIRQKMNNLGVEFTATKVICDFEAGMGNAWEVVFNVEVQGCLYHSCNDFITETTTLGLTWYVRNNDIIRRIVRISCALPLLPENKMLRGWRLLVNEARQEGQGIFRLVRPYLRYLHESWINNPVKRRRLCVYKAKRRTNNSCESNNRRFKDEAGIHPDIYDFIDALRKMELRSYKDIRGLQQGRRVGRSRKIKYINNDERLRNLTQDLDDPPDNEDAAIWRFLRRASRIMQRAFDDQVGEQEEQPAQ